MKAYIVTYCNERISSIRPVEIADDYDGDCYGDKVPFSLGSNQSIVTKEDEHLWAKCEAHIMKIFVDEEVARLRSMGWQKADFAKALKDILEKIDD
jgi:hypothetical protein